MIGLAAPDRRQLRHRPDDRHVRARLRRRLVPRVHGAATIEPMRQRGERRQRQASGLDAEQWLDQVHQQLHRRGVLQLHVIGFFPVLLGATVAVMLPVRAAEPVVARHEEAAAHQPDPVVGRAGPEQGAMTALVHEDRDLVDVGANHRQHRQHRDDTPAVDEPGQRRDAADQDAEQHHHGPPPEGLVRHVPLPRHTNAARAHEPVHVRHGRAGRRQPACVTSRRRTRRQAAVDSPARSSRSPSATSCRR